MIAKPATRSPRSIGKRILIGVVEVIALSAFILYGGYASLVATSDPISSEQRQIVDRAIALLEEKGLSRQAFVLRNMVKYRSTDNWFNRRVGHDTAYAATNFPFEVVTLYPKFFSDPVDDVERAAILLHESYHLLGKGEDRAYAGVWTTKWQIGWTGDRYSRSIIWMDIRNLTRNYAPHLFRCGPDGNSDCTE